MEREPKKGLPRIVDAAFNSVAGLKAALVNEAAFRQECVLMLILVPASFWVGQTAVERSLLVGSCLLVLITELMNSAVEAVVDRVSLEHHILSGRAKDLGSAAVLLSLILMGVIWVLIGAQNFLGSARPA